MERIIELFIIALAVFSIIFSIILIFILIAFFGNEIIPFASHIN